MVSFDAYGSVADMTSDGWFDDNGIDFSATGGRFGGGAIVDSDQLDDIKLKVFSSPSTNTLVIGWSWYLERAPSNDDNIFSIVDDDSAAVIDLIFKTNGDIDVEDSGNNVVGTFTPPLATWFRIEIKVGYGGSAAIDIEVDEANVVSGTADTDSFQGTGFEALRFDSGRIGATDGYRVDDILIQDTTGTVNNDFAGDIKIAALFPNGAGSSAQFTSNGAANNWEAVNETGSPDGDTTYNRSETNGDRDLFTVEDLPDTPNSIVGVQTTLVVRKDDTGGKDFAHVIKSGTTTDVGTSVGAANSYQWNRNVYDTNPDTAAAWTESGVNGLEVGYEVAS
jgi:hypothetical protein